MDALGFPTPYPVHQPGYPAWVFLGTMLRATGLSSYLAYEFWSIAASIVGPCLLFTCLLNWTNRSRAWWLALGYGVNPLMWFHAVTALNYTFAAMLGLAVVSILSAPWDAKAERRIHLAAALLGISLLIRPDLLLWLGPLLVFHAWRKRRFTVLRVCLILAASLMLLMVVHRWIYSRSDLGDSDRQIAYTLSVILNTSVFNLGWVDGLFRNSFKLFGILTWGLGLFAILLPMAVYAAWRQRRVFVAWWLLPPLGFLLLIHMSESGHVLPLLAPLYVLIALGYSSSDSKRPLLWMRVAVAFSILQFLFYPWSSQTQGAKRHIDAKVAYLSAAGLRHIDERSKIHTPGDFWPTKAHQPIR